MSKSEDLKHRIETDEDFINSPKYSNSLKNVLEDNPDGIEDNKIARYLCIEEKEVENIFQSAINKLKKLLEVKDA